MPPANARALIQQWCHEQQASGSRILGLCAPPGSGKSWLSRQIAGVASLSIDDLYWPQPQLQQQQRGLPGSHDLPLLAQILDDFRRHGQAEAPCFDKSLAGGAGDRRGQRQLQGQLLLLEGWCVGARGLPLLEPYAPIWAKLDGLLLLEPPNPGRVRRWRLQAEARQRRAGGGALSAGAVGAMLERFYTCLPPETCFAPLLEAPALPSWSLQLDYQRRPQGPLRCLRS